MPYIDFVGQLPDLLADKERRAREPRRPPVPPTGADKSARIAALIAELDQVAARQWGQPGGISLGESPIVKALIDEGDDAVGPLIDALERATRLTRSVHFWRDFHRSRTIMGAHEAAYTALIGILKTPFFGAASTGDNLSARGPQGRKAVADRVRAYWEKNRGIPLVERWYRTLADDGAGLQRWLQAAGNIVQHENVAVRRSPLAVRRHPGGAPHRALEPAGTAVAFRLDLRTLFPVDRPGRYRLEVTFDDLKTGAGAPGTVATDFSVLPRKSE